MFSDPRASLLAAAPRVPLPDVGAFCVIGCPWWRPRPRQRAHSCTPAVCLCVCERVHTNTHRHARIDFSPAVSLAGVLLRGLVTPFFFFFYPSPSSFFTFFSCTPTVKSSDFCCLGAPLANIAAIAPLTLFANSGRLELVPCLMGLWKGCCARWMMSRWTLITDPETSTSSSA